MLMNLLCILPLAACSEPREWSFVQSVGGVELGQAIESHGKWLLPIRANVAGVEAITVKPTLLNSTLVCESVTAKVSGHEIYLTINTSVVRPGLTAACPAAKLGKLPTGQYQVFYKSPQQEPQPLVVIGIGP